MSFRSTASTTLVLAAIVSSIATSSAESWWTAHDTFDQSIALEEGETTVRMEAHASLETIEDQDWSVLRAEVTYTFGTATYVDVTAWGGAEGPQTFTVDASGHRAYRFDAPLEVCNPTDAGLFDCVSDFGLDLVADGSMTVDIEWTLNTNGPDPDLEPALALALGGVERTEDASN